MSHVGRFTLPDHSGNPRYFVEFLELLDRLPEMKEVRARSFQQMRIPRGAHVLDVGCGLGTAVREMADIVGDKGMAYGVDISEAMIEEASLHTGDRKNIALSVGQAYALAQDDGTLDAVRMERVLLYMTEREKAVAEMIRVTKPGGRVVITDVDFDCNAITGKDRTLTRKMTSLVADSCVHSTSGRELPSLLRVAGLRDVTIEFMAVPTPYEFCIHATQGALRTAVEGSKVTAAEVEEWYRGLAELEAAGDFLQLWFFVIVGGTVLG